MPRELICVDKEKLAWRDYEERPLQAGEVRVASEFSAAKHGTEMALYKGYAAARGRFDPKLQLFERPSGKAPWQPFGLGNMTVGRVVQISPDASGLSVGQRVLIYGGFRPTHIRKAGQCWKLGDHVSWQTAVCLDPADFALGAVRDGHVRLGDAVAVLGLGAIGLMVVQLARLAGASPIIASDPIASRRQLALSLGADVGIDSHGCDVGLAIKQATDGRGADVVIDYSGSVDAMNDALRGVAFGGKVVSGSFPPPYEAGLDLGAESHLNIPDIVFSRACSEPHRDAPRWNEKRLLATILRLMHEGRLGAGDIVTPVVAFDELLNAYPRIATEPQTFIKLGCRYA